MPGRGETIKISADKVRQIAETKLKDLIQQTWTKRSKSLRHSQKHGHGSRITFLVEMLIE